jgi:hypothetical protein
MADFNHVTKLPSSAKHKQFEVKNLKKKKYQTNVK